MNRDTVTIATLSQEKAEKLSSKLKEEKIHCVLENAFSIRPTFGKAVRVKINKNDVEKAFRIMIKLKEDSDNESLAEAAAISEVKKILVPVDFSEYSLNACRYAADLAIKTDAELKLLHVYFLPEVDTVVTDGHTMPFQKLKEEVEADAEQLLNELITTIKTEIESFEANELGLNYEMLNGLAHEEIIQLAEIYEPDIIIMGTRGNETDDTAFIGSVTEKVIEYVKMPVLAIPKLTHYKSFRDINRVLYATNFDESDFTAIKKLMKIIKPFDLKLDFIHVADKTLNQWDKLKFSGLKEYLSKVHGKSDIRCEIVYGMKVPTAYKAYIKTNGIGILALTQYKRNILNKLLEPGLTHEILMQSDIPLLIFHQ